MFSIADYDKRYRPYDKSGGELKHADWVKLPVKPKGEGLQALLEHRRGLEVFGIWGLLLEKATAEKKPENRGKLLNHKEEPATVTEIAKSISLPKKERLVAYALSVLVSMGWVELDSESEETSGELPQTSAKSSVEKSSVVKSRVEKEKVRFLDFVFLTKEEHRKLVQRYGENPVKKLVDALNRYIGQSGKQYKSHYYTLLNFAKRDELKELLASETEKERAEKEAKELEKARRKIRDDYGGHLRERTTEELQKILNTPRDQRRLIAGWFIREILDERKEKQ